MEELHELLIKENYFSKELEELDKKLNDVKYQEKVFNVLKRDKKFKGSFEEFKERFLKKKTQGGGLDLAKQTILKKLEEKKSEGNMESDSEDSSLESPFNNKIEASRKETIPGELEIKSIEEIQEVAPFQPTINEQFKIAVGETIPDNMPVEEVDEAIAMGNQKRFNNSLKLLNPQLINKAEENAVPYLNSMFEEYGYDFEQATIFADAMKVYAPEDENGNREMIRIDLQPFGGLEARERELQKLQTFMDKTATADVKRNRNISEKTILENREKEFSRGKLKFSQELGEFEREVNELEDELFKISRMSAADKVRNREKIEALNLKKEELLQREQKFKDQEKELGEEADELTKQRRRVTGEENTGVENLFGKWFLTDFLGDMQRAWVKGQARGASVDEALALMNLGGKPPTDEELQDFMIANERMKQYGESDEMIAFNEAYEKYGGGIGGFVMGFLNAPTVLPEVFTSSVGAMLTEAPVIAGLSTFATTVATTTAAGAVTGSAAAGVGAVPGAIGGFLGGLAIGARLGIGALGTTLESGATYAELLNAELGDDANDMNKLKELLDDEERMNSFRNKAIARGLAIGTIDAITFGMASLATKSTAKLAGSKLLAATAGTGVESLGGALGEMTGMIAAGQKLDAKEILFEGTAGLSTAPLSVGIGLYQAPTYKLNGGEVSGREMAKFLRTATDKQIAEANITIKNDKTLLGVAKEKRTNAIDRYYIEKDIDPEIKGEARERLIELELERTKLVNNETQSGKNKLKKIEKEINEISEGKYKPKEKTDIETFFEEKDKAGGEDSAIGTITDIVEEGKGKGKKAEDVKPQTFTPITESVSIEESPLSDNQKQEILDETGSIDENDNVVIESVDESGKAIVRVERTNNATGQVTTTQINVNLTPEQQVQEDVQVDTETTDETTPSKGRDTVKETEGVLEITNDNYSGGKVTIKGTQVGDGVYLTTDPDVKGAVEKNPVSAKIKETVINNAIKVAKAIKKIAPGVNIILAQNKAEFQKASGRVRNILGTYNSVTNDIYINLDAATPGTVAHEAFHAMLRNGVIKINSISQSLKPTVEAIKKILNADAKASKNPDKYKSLLDKIDKYLTYYEKNSQNEEFVAEIITEFSKDFNTLPVPAQNQIVEFIKKVFQKLGLGKALPLESLTSNEKQIGESLNAIITSLTEGKTVEQSDVDAIVTPTPETKDKKTTTTETDKTQLDMFEESAPETTKPKEPKVETPTPKKKSINKVLGMVRMSGRKFIDKNATSKAALEKLIEGTGYKVFVARNGNYYLRNKNTGKIYTQGQKETGIDKTAPSKKEMTPQERESKIKQYIKDARDNNFTDKEISEYLTKVQKFSKKEVDAIIKKGEKALIPDSFTNLKKDKNSAKGIRLYKKVSRYAMSLMQRNKSRKKPLTQAQMMDRVIKFLEQQPEYKSEADVYTDSRKGKKRRGLSEQQAKMQTEIQSILGQQPTVDMRAQLSRTRSMLTNFARGRKTLSEVKTQLRNFMRQTLPKDVYTKPEVMKLIRKIDIVTKATLPGIMEEVVQFAAKKTVQSLQTEVRNKINGKYSVIQGGKKKSYNVDVEAQEQLEKIKNSTLKENATPEEIGAANQKLMEEYDKLAQKETLTESDMNSMVALEVAMELNNIGLMENTNPNKAQSLLNVNSQLDELIFGGKERLREELQAKHEEYKRNTEIAYKEITGEDVDLNTEEGRAKLKKAVSKADAKRQADAAKPRIVRVVKGLLNSVGNFFARGMDVSTLMNQISVTPGEMFGGKLQELVTDKIDDATRDFKARKMINQEIIREKLKELFGPSWKKKARKMKNVFSSEIYLDAEAVKKARDEYNKNKNSETKKKLKQVIEDNSIPDVTSTTQNKLYYLYNQFKDPANHPAFENMWGPDYKRIAGEIEAALDTETKQFADWQVNEFFPSLYDYYNKKYKEIYRTNLPWNENYAGRIYRDGVEYQPLDLLGTDNVIQTSVGAASQKVRVKTNAKIAGMDGTDVLLTYLNDMEWFSAMASPLKDVDKMLLNPEISKLIKSIHGDTVFSLIKNQIEKLASKGIRSGIGAQTVNLFTDAFIVSKLGLNPNVMLKQLTSFITYANDIGPVQWIKYAPKTKSEVLQAWNEIRENSVYLKDRKYNSITKTIESYSETGMESIVPVSAKDWMVNFLMYTTKFGDRAAIYLGGMSNYRYYKAEFKRKNPNATEQQAIDYAVRKFERDTKRTQQSSDLQDKDYFQTANPIVRPFNMFLTTPKQYLRKEMQAITNMYRKILSGGKKGKGTWTQNLRTFALYHAVMPVFFQYVALGLPGLLREKREEDDEDLIRAAIIGNLNGLFIAGELIQSLGNYVLGKPWAEDVGRTIPIYDKVEELIKTKNKIDLIKGYKDYGKANKKGREYQERIDKLTKDFYLDLVEFSGLPANQVSRFFENYSEVLEGGLPPNEVILKLFNYSEYVIKGPKKKEEKKKDIKLTKEELRRYRPQEYYRQQQEERRKKNSPQNREDERRKEVEKRRREEQLRRIYNR